MCKKNIDFIENNLIFSDDLLVLNPEIKSENKLMGKKWLVFSLTTNTTLKIGNVQIKLVVEHPNGKQEEGEIKVDFLPTTVEQTKIIEYRLKDSAIINKGEPIKCALYARKKAKYDWTLIREFEVKY